MATRVQTLILALGLVGFGPLARADDIRVVVSGGAAAAYKELAPVFERCSQHRLLTEWGPSLGTTSGAIPQRLDRGEPIDVVFMVRDGIEPLLSKGQLQPGSVIDIAHSKIAMAVRKGARVPDISSVKSFRRTLLAARSVAYSDSASGLYLAHELFKRLGIDRQMAAKSREIKATPVGEVVASGQYEIGFQQYSELLPVAGIQIVGLLPAELQKITVYSAALVSGAAAVAGGRQLIDFLASPLAAPPLRASGLEPVGKQPYVCAAGAAKPE